MPKRIPAWFSQHPNLLTLLVVSAVFIWAVVQIGNEGDKRVHDVKAAETRINTRLTREAKARQEIICLIGNDSVDRDKAFIDALIAASTASQQGRVLTPDEKRRSEEGLRVFMTRLEPSLRAIECTKFIDDPVNYLRELRQRVDINPSTTSTTTARR